MDLTGMCGYCSLVHISPSLRPRNMSFFYIVQIPSFLRGNDAVRLPL